MWLGVMGDVVGCDGRCGGGVMGDVVECDGRCGGV